MEQVKMFLKKCLEIRKYKKIKKVHKQGHFFTFLTIIFFSVCTRVHRTKP